MPLFRSAGLCLLVAALTRLTRATSLNVELNPDRPTQLYKAPGAWIITASGPKRPSLGQKHAGSSSGGNTQYKPFSVGGSGGSYYVPKPQTVSYNVGTRPQNNEVSGAGDRYQTGHSSKPYSSRPKYPLNSFVVTSRPFGLHSSSSQDQKKPGGRPQTQPSYESSYRPTSRPYSASGYRPGSTSSVTSGAYRPSGASVSGGYRPQGGPVSNGGYRPVGTPLSNSYRPVPTTTQAPRHQEQTEFKETKVEFLNSADGVTRVGGSTLPTYNLGCRQGQRCSFIISVPTQIPEPTYTPYDPQIVKNYLDNYQTILAQARNITSKYVVQKLEPEKRFPSPMEAYERDRMRTQSSQIRPVSVPARVPSTTPRPQPRPTPPVLQTSLTVGAALGGQGRPGGYGQQYQSSGGYDRPNYNSGFPPGRPATQSSWSSPGRPAGSSSGQSGWSSRPQQSDYQRPSSGGFGQSPYSGLVSYPVDRYDLDDSLPRPAQDRYPSSGPYYVDDYLGTPPNGPPRMRPDDFRGGYSGQRARPGTSGYYNSIPAPYLPRDPPAAAYQHGGETNRRFSYHRGSRGLENSNGEGNTGEWKPVSAEPTRSFRSTDDNHIEETDTSFVENDSDLKRYSKYSVEKVDIKTNHSSPTPWGTIKRKIPLTGKIFKAHLRASPLMFGPSKPVVGEEVTSGAGEMTSVPLHSDVGSHTSRPVVIHKARVSATILTEDGERELPNVLAAAPAARTDDQVRKKTGWLAGWTPTAARPADAHNPRRRPSPASQMAPAAGQQAAPPAQRRRRGGVAPLRRAAAALSEAAGRLPAAVAAMVPGLMGR